jgi:hypothetical protein
MTILILISMVFVLPAMADEHENVYTFVGLWQVERAQWGDFVKFFEKHEQPVLESLFKDGVITEWGLDTTMIHKADGYTHTTWWSVHKMGDFEKVFQAFDKAWEGEDAGKLEAEFASMITKHRDYILNGNYQRSVGGSLEGAYFSQFMVKIKMGEEDAFRGYWNTYSKPMFEKLMADGVVLAYGIFEEEIATHEPGTKSGWYIIKDLSGYDVVKKAGKESWGGMSEEERRARWASIVDMAEVETYREYISRIIKGQMKSYK